MCFSAPGRCAPTWRNASTKSFEIAVRVGPPGRQRIVPRASRPRTEFLPAVDAEGERHARQPLLRVHRRVARAADEHAPLSRWFKSPHRRPDPWRHLSQWSVEHYPGGELPPGAQVLFHRCHRVEAIGRIEPVGGLLNRADPVDPIGADRVSAMGVTQEVPAPVADDDRPGIHLGLPLVAGLAPIRDQRSTSGRDG